MSSGWLSRNRYLIRMSYGNVIMSSGWHRLPSLSHPDEIVNFDFPHHAVALQRFRSFMVSIPCTHLSTWTVSRSRLFHSFNPLHIFWSRQPKVFQCFASLLFPSAFRHELMIQEVTEWAHLIWAYRLWALLRNGNFMSSFPRQLIFINYELTKLWAYYSLWN